MKKASIIYEETSVLTAKYHHPKSDDWLKYIGRIQIKDSGRTPVQMTLQFDGILPFLAPMPPEEHTIKAATVFDLYMKTMRWFGKYGYQIQAAYEESDE
jgi:hypothetical protein